MAEIVRMPKMSDTMTEGVVAKWHKKIGDKVKSGDLVAEIETDKATMEFESYQEGVLLYRGVEEGKAVPVNGVLAVLGKAGEEYKSLLLEEEKKTAVNATTVTEPQKKEAPALKIVESKSAAIETKQVQSPKQFQASATSISDGRVKASPLARKMAEEKGINLNALHGSGTDGRIIRRDIDWYKPGSKPVKSTSAPAKGPQLNLPDGFIMDESAEDVPVSQMRKTIARRLAESKFSAPHFYLTMEMDMEPLMAVRESINASMGLRLSVNDFIVKATAFALRSHPKVNSSWMGEFIRINHHVHIGVAVAVEEGLLVPVIRFADSKALTTINAEVKEYAQKARDKKLQPSDWEGNTFTISNLGMYGIDEFTAIINPPDACILAVGGIVSKPVVKNGAVVPGNTMKVTLSCDHRVVDGVAGSEFLQTLKGLLENPAILISYGNI